QQHIVAGYGNRGRGGRRRLSHRRPTPQRVQRWPASPLGVISVTASQSPPGWANPPSTRCSPAGAQRAAVSEATGANIEDLGVERGHRTLVITRKGGKVVTIPLGDARMPAPAASPSKRFNY